MSERPRSPYGAERQWDDGCVDAGLPNENIALRSVRIGEVEVTALPDSAVLCDPKRFLTAFADDLLEEYAPSLSEFPLVRLPTTCFLVRTPTRLVMVDTGIGNRGRPGQPMGHLDQRLHEAGVSPREIDLIVATHLHADHVGWWTVDLDGGPTPFFANAVCVVHQADWDYWMRDDRPRASVGGHLEECVRPLMTAGRVTLVGPREALTPELRLLPTPGHTPGHVSVGISSGGSWGVIAGDVSHQPFQLDHPEWSPIWDVDPEAAAATRDAFFDESCDDGRLVIAGHWPYPGFGHIRRMGGRRVFEALSSP